MFFVNRAPKFKYPPQLLKC